MLLLWALTSVDVDVVVGAGALFSTGVGSDQAEVGCLRPDYTLQPEGKRVRPLVGLEKKYRIPSCVRTSEPLTFNKRH